MNINALYGILVLYILYIMMYICMSELDHHCLTLPYQLWYCHSWYCHDLDWLKQKFKCYQSDIHQLSSGNLAVMGVVGWGGVGWGGVGWGGGGGGGGGVGGGGGGGGAGIHTFCHFKGVRWLRTARWSYIRDKFGLKGFDFQISWGVFSQHIGRGVRGRSQGE